MSDVTYGNQWLQSVWDGKKFHNPVMISQHSFWDLVQFLFFTKKPKWPVLIENKIKNINVPKLVGEDRITITFINHSSFLIQTHNINILTDPIWSYRCSPVSFAGPKRSRMPGVRFEDLPPINIVLISHNHYDHMDIPTLQNIFNTNPAAIFITGLKNSRILKNQNIQNVVELDWWQEYQINENIKIYFVPAKHFSARSLFDRNQTLWGGFVIQLENKHIYFMGDSGYDEKLFNMIATKFNNIILSFIPIGAYQPRWFMKDVHINPEEAIFAHKILKSKVSIAMHYGTFPLAADRIEEPLEDLQKAQIKHNITNEEFIKLDFGESKDFVF